MKQAAESATCRLFLLPICPVLATMAALPNSLLSGRPMKPTTLARAQAALREQASSRSRGAKLTLLYGYYRPCSDVFLTSLILICIGKEDVVICSDRV